MRPNRHVLLLVLAWAGASGLTACSSGDAPLGVVDPGAAPADPSFEQVFGIVQRDCAPCHDQGGTEPRYDTCEDLLENLDELVTEALQRNSMPPGAWPRLNSEDRLILTRWIAQGADAPCDD